MKFLIKDVFELKRINNLNAKNDEPYVEEITIEIKLISSGYTKCFSSQEIINIITDKLQVINPTEKESELTHDKCPICGEVTFLYDNRTICGSENCDWEN